ncbi:ketosteroid isomerase-like protein [Catenulispora sp. GP43]|uniref:nuclear transport factor 2 family protein n=1 Tax=Catenulispora sp. GP43 TaxID=3156263 RepID=UPI00351288D5
MNAAATPAEVFKQSQEAFLAKDMRAWADLCAEDVLVEFPFSPEGLPSTLQGRQAIFEYLRYYPTIIDIHEIDSVTVYATDKPETVVAEWSVKGHVIPNGNKYDMAYATFVTVRAGRITGYREYWNPLTFGQALEGVSFG